jgi:hypothetical protein
MTLREVIAANPGLFYPQTWYEGEAFMDYRGPHLPERVGAPSRIRPGTEAVIHAVTLAELYMRSRKDPIWNRYLWCADVDSQGQRVYVGGVGNTGRFEIHRHLHLTDRWGVPSWS